MTLKEKFKQWLDTEPRLQIREVQLEEIADDFAIGFAEWITQAELPLEELLETFKKEQGL
jgi:hypothetical protein